MIVDGINIEPQHGSAGTHPVSINITAVNEGLDKSITIDGVCGDKTAPLTIIHEGMREIFSCTNGDFMCVNGTFNVLKGATLLGEKSTKRLNISKAQANNILIQECM